MAPASGSQGWLQHVLCRKDRAESRAGPSQRRIAAPATLRVGSASLKRICFRNDFSHLIQISDLIKQTKSHNKLQDLITNYQISLNLSDLIRFIRFQRKGTKSYQNANMNLDMFRKTVFRLRRPLNCCGQRACFSNGDCGVARWRAAALDRFSPHPPSTHSEDILELL